MTSNERQEAVRNINHLHDSYPIEALNMTINEVMCCMVDSGVSKKVVESSVSVYCIAQGVDDLMRTGGTFSQYFKDRVCQLSAYDDSEVEE